MGDSESWSRVGVTTVWRRVEGSASPRIREPRKAPRAGNGRCGQGRLRADSLKKQDEKAKKNTVFVGARQMVRVWVKSGTWASPSALMSRASDRSAARSGRATGTARHLAS